MNEFDVIRMVLISSTLLYVVLGVRLSYIERKRPSTHIHENEAKSEADIYGVAFAKFLAGDRMRLAADPYLGGRLMANSALAALGSPMPEQHAGASAQDMIGIATPQMTLRTNATGESLDPANDRGLPLYQQPRGGVLNFAEAM
jgi:hypothetical protein